MSYQLLLEEFCHYAEYIKGASKDTNKRYREKISFFFRFSNITEINEISEKLVQEFFMRGRLERHWKPNTYHTYFMTLIVFFRWCVKHQHLEKNYAIDIELPKIEKSLPNKLTKQDAMKLLEISYNYPYTQKSLKYRNHAIFSLFLFAGLRKSELLNIKYADIDIENLSIFVRQGKGNKDRIIPMTFTLAKTLKRYIIERQKQKKTCSEFFACSNRNRGLSDSGLKDIVLKLRKAIGIHFTIHQLRHTFATLMLEGGCDIYSLSKMMGHSDIKTTTIYLSASAEHLRSQVVKHPMNIEYPSNDKERILC